MVVDAVQGEEETLLALELHVHQNPVSQNEQVKIMRFQKILEHLCVLLDNLFCPIISPLKILTHEIMNFKLRRLVGKVECYILNHEAGAHEITIADDHAHPIFEEAKASTPFDDFYDAFPKGISIK